MIDTQRIMSMRSAIIESNTALQRAAAAASGAAPQDVGGVTGFGDAMRDAVTKVNAVQGRASDLSASFERGETTDIAAVMLARQEASVGFEATLQVRNKLLGAYRDVMNMPD